MSLRVGYVDAATVAFDVFADGQKATEQRPPAAPAGVGVDRTVTTLKSYSIPAAAGPVVEIRFAGRAELGFAHIVFCELNRLPP